MDDDIETAIAEEIAEETAEATAQATAAMASAQAAADAALVAEAAAAGAIVEAETVAADVQAEAVIEAADHIEEQDQWRTETTNRMVALETQQAEIMGRVSSILELLTPIPEPLAEAEATSGMASEATELPAQNPDENQAAAGPEPVPETAARQGRRAGIRWI